MSKESVNCHFCDIFGSSKNQISDPIFDKIIWSNNDFVIVPAKGALVEGYLLIITKEHHLCMAELSCQLLSDLSKIKSFIREILSKEFMPPIFFEHGPACQTDKGDKGGACIDHAHMHCVPFKTDILPISPSYPQLVKFENVVKLETYEDIKYQIMRNKSYLYYENQKMDKFLIFASSVPSQFFRRLMAMEIGATYEWDWSVFTFRDNVISTLRKLENSKLNPFCNL